MATRREINRSRSKQADDREPPGERQLEADEDTGQSVADEEEEMEHDDDLDAGAEPPHSAQVAAALHSHYKAASDYLDGEMASMDNPGMKAHLQKHKDEHIAGAMDHLREGMEEHHPDHDLDELSKGLEADTGGGSPDMQTGERDLVDQGDVPPDSVQAGLDEDVDEGAVPFNKEEEPADEEEIMERYEDESKNWRHRVVGRLRRTKSGKVFVVWEKGYRITRKDMLNEGNPDEYTPDADRDQTPEEGNTRKGLSPKHLGVVQRAADHMEAMTQAPDVPPYHHAGLKHHSQALKSMCKELTDQGATESDVVNPGADAGPPLTDEGNPAEIGKNVRPLTRDEQKSLDRLRRVAKDVGIDLVNGGR